MVLCESSAGWLEPPNLTGRSWWTHKHCEFPVCDIFPGTIKMPSSRPCQMEPREASVHWRKGTACNEPESARQTVRKNPVLSLTELSSFRTWSLELSQNHDTSGGEQDFILFYFAHVYACVCVSLFLSLSCSVCVCMYVTMRCMMYVYWACLQKPLGVLYHSPLDFIETESLTEPGTRLAASSPSNPPVSVLPIYVTLVVTFYMDASKCSYCPH